MNEQQVVETSAQGGEVSDAELMAAVVASRQSPEAPAEQDAEQAPKGAPDAPKDSDGQQAAPDQENADEPKKAPAKERLAEMLRRKEAEHRQRSDYDARSRELRQEKESLDATRRELQVQQARFKKFAEDPIEGLREFGHDPERVMEQVARSASPEAKLQQEVLRLSQAMQQQMEQTDQRIRQMEQRAQQAEQSARAHAQAQQEQKFVAAAEQAAPSASLLWGTDDLLVKAYRVIESCKSAGLVPTDEDVLGYLEEQASERLAQIRLRQGGETVPARTKVNTSNPLSAKKSGERRSTPTDWDSLSEEEQDQELMRAVREAGRNVST